MSMKRSNDDIGNRTRDLPACSAVPKPNAQRRDIRHRLIVACFLCQCENWSMTFSQKTFCMWKLCGSWSHLSDTKPNYVLSERLTTHANFSSTYDNVEECDAIFTGKYIYRSFWMRVIGQAVKREWIECLVLKMEALFFAGTSVNVYQLTRCHVSQYLYLYHSPFCNQLNLLIKY